MIIDISAHDEIYALNYSEPTLLEDIQTGRITHPFQLRMLPELGYFYVKGQEKNRDIITLYDNAAYGNSLVTTESFLYEKYEGFFNLGALFIDDNSRWNRTLYLGKHSKSEFDKKMPNLILIPARKDIISFRPFSNKPLLSR